MLSVIILTINGDTFLFKDDNFTKEQYDALQELGDSGFVEDDENKTCSVFVETVRTKLHISLDPVVVSQVVRIKHTNK